MTTSVTSGTASTTATKTISIEPGMQIDHQTICDLFGIPPRGCIRENKHHSRLVLISDRTRQPTPDQWTDDILHFVGAPDDGPFLRSRLNRRLAKSTDYAIPVHLFNKYPLGRYEYVGPVELADHPYSRDNRDQAGQLFTEWVFPLRLRSNLGTGMPSPIASKLLPYACSAVIRDNIPPDKRRAAFELLDQMKALGVTVIDQRDIEDERYRSAESKYYDHVISYMEKEVRANIKRLKSEARRQNQKWGYQDDELELDGTLDRIKSVFELIGYDGEFNDLQDRASRAFQYPDPPDYYELMGQDGSEAAPSSHMKDLLKPKIRTHDFSKIDFGGE